MIILVKTQRHWVWINETIKWNNYSSLKGASMGNKVDWGYFRNSWKTCKRAQEFLDANNISVNEITNASKEKIDANQAWEMIKSASSIHVAKGKKTISWNPKSDDREEILKTVMGPSGNLRAPTWKIGSDILVGFSEEQYQQVLGWWFKLESLVLPLSLIHISEPTRPLYISYAVFC